MSAQEIGPAGLRPRGGRLELEGGPLRLELDPARGGRVSRLCLDAAELLVGESVHPSNWGSTYWTSPQEDWGWPPVPAIDHEPYAVSSEGKTVVLTSAPAFAGRKHLSVTKRFTLDEARAAIDVEYVVSNLGSEAFSIAGWEISRVPRGGLSFFRAGAREYTLVGPHTILPTSKQLGVSWFDHRHFVPGRGAKLNADSTGGWLAHVVRAPSGQGVLWLKTFEPVPLEEQAPGEGVVELYADELGAYVEVENQGPYARIEPGAAHTYRVTWLLRRLPGGVDVAVGSPSLLGLVQSLVDAP